MHITNLGVLGAVGLTLGILFCTKSKLLPKPQKLMVVTMLPTLWMICLRIPLDGHLLLWTMSDLPWIVWLNFRVWAIAGQPRSTATGSSSSAILLKDDVFGSKWSVSAAALVTRVSLIWFSFMFAGVLLISYGFTSKHLLFAAFCLSGFIALVSLAVKRHVRNTLNA